MSDTVDHLSPADLAALMAARRHVQRAEAEHRAAEAERDLALLDLQECLGGLQETYAIGPGDKLTPTGEIVRAEPAGEAATA